MMKTATKTTRVPERVSFRDGQVTFFNSVLTSLKNCFATSNFSFIGNSIDRFPLPRRRRPCQPAEMKWQARRDLNPHHPDLESGALSVRATGLYPAHFHPPLVQLLCLFMNRMLTTEPAVFLELQLIRSRPFILCRRVVSPFTLCAGQR